MILENRQGWVDGSSDGARHRGADEVNELGSIGPATLATTPVGRSNPPRIGWHQLHGAGASAQ